MLQTTNGSRTRLPGCCGTFCRACCSTLARRFLETLLHRREQVLEHRAFPLPDLGHDLHAWREWPTEIATRKLLLLQRHDRLVWRQVRLLGCLRRVTLLLRIRGIGRDPHDGPFHHPV